MKPLDFARAHILASGALGALTEALRHGGAGLSRRTAEAAPGLLRGYAVEMTGSPLARDQVLSLALLAAADDLEAGRTPAASPQSALPQPAPDEAARLDIRTRVLRLGPAAGDDVRRAVEDVERRRRAECAGDLDLASRLRVEATLQERFWDDPRLPADDGARLTMLFSVPELLDRADALGPEHRGRAGRGRTVRRADRRPPWRLRRVAGGALPAEG